jgi:membrane-associated protein
LSRAHRFYEKHGGKTIILARFMPFIRTFAPFVAGIGAMTYWKFLLYNVVGGAAWIACFVYGGYFFGTLPWVERRFHLVIAAIIVISVLPAAIEFIRHRRRPPAGPSRVPPGSN